jgi:pilus assembly protein Flp/PilA
MKELDRQTGRDAGEQAFHNGKKGEAMRNLINRAKMFVGHEDGPTATEYAVMLALIVIVALTAISSLGSKVSDIFSTVDGGLSAGG